MQMLIPPPQCQCEWYWLSFLFCAEHAYYGKSKALRNLSLLSADQQHCMHQVSSLVCWAISVRCDVIKNDYANQSYEMPCICSCWAVQWTQGFHATLARHAIFSEGWITARCIQALLVSRQLHYNAIVQTELDAACSWLQESPTRFHCQLLQPHQLGQGCREICCIMAFATHDVLDHHLCLIYSSAQGMLLSRPLVVYLVTNGCFEVR